MRSKVVGIEDHRDFDLFHLEQKKRRGRELTLYNTWFNMYTDIKGECSSGCMCDVLIFLLLGSTESPHLVREPKRLRPRGE